MFNFMKIQLSGPLFQADVARFPAFSSEVGTCEKARRVGRACLTVGNLRGAVRAVNKCACRRNWPRAPAASACLYRENRPLEVAQDDGPRRIAAGAEADIRRPLKLDVETHLQVDYQGAVGPEQAELEGGHGQVAR